MEVRIYRPAKTAMQSGRGNTKKWVLEFEPTDATHPDQLMGWIGSGDTKRQVRLRFESEEEAVQYAKKHGYTYTIERPNERNIRPKAYADNFSYYRKEPWTH